MPPKQSFTPTFKINLHSYDATKTLIYTNISDPLTHCYDATKTLIYTNIYDLLTHFLWYHQNTHLHQLFYPLLLPPFFFYSEQPTKEKVRLASDVRL